MKLIIFDLDQTLVDFISVHDETTQRVFKEFFNVEAQLSDIDFSGKSLTECLRELARMKNVPEDLFRSRSGHLLPNYEKTFSESMPEDASKNILPGVRELLEALSRTDHYAVLYTGGPPRIVETCLRATDLGKYFKFRQYGTEVPTRADMVRLAIEKARTLTGHEFKGKDIVIIGDSIRDVECGRLFNALVLAVTTGFHSAEQLRKAGADYIFRDLKDYRKLLTVIDGHGPT
ncbi:MAG: HAD family hydrolase [Chloroflexota bacterium]